MKLRNLLIPVVFLFASSQALAYKLLIPMDSSGQKNHLKAYGITFAALSKQIKVSWLLNYRGGSYVMETSNELMSLCKERGVSYEILSDHQYKALKKEINSDDFNGTIVLLDKTPKIAVYSSPDTKMWDDAVVLALDYASIPYERIYVEEVLNGSLNKYDWVHIHHEDFTGRYGKFWTGFKNAQWYQEQQKNYETLATKFGFKKVSQMQLAVAKKLREFVVQGGNMFAMCSATETFDIALASEGMDICPAQYDGDGVSRATNNPIDYTNCLAFKDFEVNLDPYDNRQSSIGDYYRKGITKELDYFYLYKYPAKENKISSMLCQNHTDKIKGFLGQATGYNKEVLKPGIQVMGVTAVFIQKYSRSKPEFTPTGEARYLHGNLGKGTWTYYGGHDPESYKTAVGDPTTDLNQFPHSPGYRLILNNIMYPAAERDAVPTVVMTDSTLTSSKGVAKESQMEGSVSLKVYPNPTSKVVEITFSPSEGNPTGTKKIEYISVVNSDGKLMHEKAYDSEKIQLDMSSYPAGVYYIQVNGQYSGDIIKY